MRLMRRSRGLPGEPPLANLQDLLDRLGIRAGELRILRILCNLRKQGSWSPSTNSKRQHPPLFLGVGSLDLRFQFRKTCARCQSTYVRRGTCSRLRGGRMSCPE